MSAPKLSDECAHCPHTRYSHKEASPESRAKYAGAEDVPDGRCWALHCTCTGFVLERSPFALIKSVLAAAKRGDASEELRRLDAELFPAAVGPLERGAPTPPAAAYAAPAGACFCCGLACPGLSWRASTETPHPRTCLAAGQERGDQATPRTLLTELIGGLLGKETAESRAAVANYFRDPGLSSRLNSAPTCPRCGAPMAPLEPAAAASKGFSAGAVTCMCGITCTAEGARSEHVRESFAASKRHEAEAATVPNEKEQAALAFCFDAAAGDSGGQRRVRQFLFAWHNAGELGGFDFADLWSLDERHLAAVLTVIRMIARGPTGHYPHHYGYDADMTALIETYGPIEAGDRVEGERVHSSDGRDVSRTGRVERIDDRKRVAYVVWDGGGRSECLTSELCRL